MANRVKRYDQRKPIRQHYKIDSIIRLVYALERDVDRLMSKPNANSIPDGLDFNSKLDLISDKLLEIRDKLEFHSKTPNNSSSGQQNPTSLPFATRMPLNSYPFIPRIMF